MYLALAGYGSPYHLSYHLREGFVTSATCNKSARRVTIVHAQVLTKLIQYVYTVSTINTCEYSLLAESSYHTKSYFN